MVTAEENKENKENKQEELAGMEKLRQQALLYPNIGNYSNKLSAVEKIAASKNIIFSNSAHSNYIANPGEYLSKNFHKIDGFDARWNSLITNNPLLFEDIDYVRIKQYIDNQITDEERAAYMRGDLREMYATFDSMLACNLQFYDRIISFCTMVFFHYVRVNGDIVSQSLEKVPYELDMTPTKIWCCALTSVTSTDWELNYAWGMGKKITETPIEGSDKSVLEVSWKKIYKNQTFAKFTEYSAARCCTEGFRVTRAADITPNRKLAQVCAKYTKASVAISDQQLDGIADYINEVEDINKRLYASLNSCLKTMYAGHEGEYAIYVFKNEFIIHTSKFSIKVTKNDEGKITKHYLANTYECFAAEEQLAPSIKMQLEWAKYQMPVEYNYDKDILITLLTTMLEQDAKNIICFKRMNEHGINAKVTFNRTKTFANVRIMESYIADGKAIRTEEDVILKPSNAAAYLVNKGYFTFGVDPDVYSLIEINRANIIKHYSNYCIPVMTYMEDVIEANIKNKNDIIDVVCKGDVEPERINNKNIKYTNLVEINTRELMQQALSKQNKRKINVANTYWKAIDDR